MNNRNIIIAMCLFVIICVAYGCRTVQTADSSDQLFCPLHEIVLQYDESLVVEHQFTYDPEYFETAEKEFPASKDKINSFAIDHVKYFCSMCERKRKIWCSKRWIKELLGYAYSETTTSDDGEIQIKTYKKGTINSIQVFDSDHVLREKYEFRGMRIRVLMFDRNGSVTNSQTWKRTSPRSESSL